MNEARPIYPLHFYRDSLPPREAAFILMPFHESFAQVHTAIRQSIEDAGLVPERADDVFNTRAGMEKILKGIGECRVVVADMTGRNANVFYEVGIAHAVREGVILLAQDVEDIPFDIRHIDHLIYSDTPEGRGLLQTRLTDIIRKVDSESNTSRDPIADSVPNDRVRRVRDLTRGALARWTILLEEQTKVADQRFGGRIGSDTASLAQAAHVFLPTLEEPWLPLESVGGGFAASGDLNGLRLVLEAASRALSFNASEHSTSRLVAGQPHLIVLRSYMLWGAIALDSGHWGLVQELLSRPLQVVEHGERRILRLPRWKMAFTPTRRCAMPSLQLERSSTETTR